MMYHKYKDGNFKSASGLEFLSIALKRSESALNAIAKDECNLVDHIVETPNAEKAVDYFIWD
ncbi:MAG: hypothetical protein IPI90_15670 [Saprospiraceae bacterium]|nr:hypothetical protein [Candidatus Vicinibacter affinis]